MHKNFYFMMIISFLLLTPCLAETTARIVPTPKDPTTAEPLEGTSDNEITDKTNRSITASNMLIGHIILVTSINGYVTLNGVVNSQAQADEAMRIAKSVYGVRDVKSNIVVQPPTTIIIQP